MVVGGTRMNSVMVMKSGWTWDVFWSQNLLAHWMFDVRESKPLRRNRCCISVCIFGCAFCFEIKKKLTSLFYFVLKAQYFIWKRKQNAHISVSANSYLLDGHIHINSENVLNIVDVRNKVPIKFKHTVFYINSNDRRESALWNLIFLCENFML